MPHSLIPPLESLAARTCTELGFQLCKLSLLTHRIPMTLQVMVQRGDGRDISLDECASLSGPLSDALNAAGLLDDQAYVLEVSSPGVSDELRDDRDFRSFRGFPVAVRFTDRAGAEASCEGLLLERSGEELRINQRGRTRRIPRDSVIQVQLVTTGSSA